MKNGGSKTILVLLALVLANDVGASTSPPVAYASLLGATGSGARAGASSSPTPAAVDPDAALPAQLIVPEAVRDVMRMMWRRSPTFRRQCARIASAGAGSLTITVIRGLPSRRDAYGALTHVRRTSGTVLRAQVYLGGPIGDVESLAHELEHIIEQLDGVDLAEQAHRPYTGVTAIGAAAFETERALRAGRCVAAEVRSVRP
jgi:hypothetical protein